MSETPIQVAGYTRVSTVQQQEGYGLEAQREEIEAYAKRRGWEIVGWYSDVESARKKKAKERAGLDAALSAAKRGEYQILLVREVTRFSRTARDALETAETLHEVGAWLEDINSQSSKNKLTFTILAAVAEDEGAKINERIRGGMRVAGRRGKFGGGPAPYGYAIHPIRERTAPEWNTLVVNPEEAATVQELFELAALPDGSILKTTREAEKRGLQNRDGKPFSKTHLAELLRDEIYLGEGRKRMVLGEEVVTPAPAILAPALFDQVGEALERNKMRYYPRSNERHTYPLRKRIVHVHPDGSIWGMGGEFPRGSRRHERLYRCQSWRERSVECPGMSPPGTPDHLVRTSITAALAERYVLQLGLDAIEEPDRIAELADNVTRTKLAVLENRETRADIERRIAELDKERDRTLEQNRKGWIEDDKTEKLLNDIAVRRADLEVDLARITSTLDTESLSERLMRVEINGEVPDWWESNGYEPPEAGILTPGDPAWPALVAGLKDEVRGEAPDQDPRELSEWAKSWTSHIVTTLDIYLVVPETSYLDAYATMGDPRIGI